MLVRHYFWSGLYIVVKAIINRKYYIWKTYDLDSLMIGDKHICLGFNVCKKP